MDEDVRLHFHIEDKCWERLKEISEDIVNKRWASLNTMALDEFIKERICPVHIHSNGTREDKKRLRQVQRILSLYYRYVGMKEIDLFTYEQVCLWLTIPAIRKNTKKR